MRLSNLLPEETTSLRAVGWFFPVNLIAVLLLVATPESLAANFLSWLGVVLITNLICAATFVVTSRFNKSDGRRLTTLIIVGLLRGLVLISLSGWSPISDEANSFGRLFNSTLTVVIWFALIGRALNSANNYDANYRALLGQTTASTLTLIGAEYRRITAPLSKLLEQAELNAIDEKALKLIASEIRQSVETRIRPFSHRIWFSEITAAPKIRLRMLFQDSLSLPMPILRDFLLVTIPAAAIGIVVFESSFSGVLELIGIVLTSWPALVLLQRVSRKLSYTRFNKLTVLIAPMFGFITTFVGHAVNQMIDPTDSNYISLSALALAISLYSVLLTMYRLAQHDQKLVVNALSEISTNPRELAAFVHNTVQSGLLASASVLELASSSGNRDQVKHSLAQAQHLAGLDIAVDFAQFLGNPRTRLTGLVSNWKGIADVRLSVPENIADENLVSVIEIVEESIANAVRKANANTISIEITQNQTELSVTISNNGKVIPGEPGLGTAWLDSITNGNWHRTFNDSGSCLVVVLPRMV